MNEEHDYKLFHSVDPTKIKIPFNERFAKLTLSSNKKKKTEQQKVVCEDGEEKQLLRKRSNASCNLLKLLNESEQQQQQNKNNSSNVNNPLLRSDSSSRGSTEHLDEEDDIETSMETLEVSLEKVTTIVGQQIELLSQKLSTLSMKQELNVAMNSPKEETSIVLSSDTQSESGADSEDSSVIVISDASGSDSQQSYETTKDFNDEYVPVSWLSDETSSINLPQQQQKAQLMAAFLKDVAQAQKQGLQDHPTVDYSNQVELTKAQILAAADTESMTMTEYDVEVHPEAKPNERLLSLNSTLPETKSSTVEISFPLTTESEQNQPLKLNNANALAEDETELNTLNTFAEDHDNSVNQQNSVILNDSAVENVTKSSAVDSLIISETSSENIRNEQEEEKEKLKSKPKSLSTRSTLSTGNENVSPELSSSEEVTISSHINISAKISVKIQIQQMSSEDENLNTTERKSTPSLPGSSESQIIEENAQNNTKNDDKIDEVQLKNTEVNNDNEEEDEGCSNENIIEQSLTKEKHCLEVNEEANQQHFMSHAEKVLSEIYGNSWRTPQILRTLKTASHEKCAKSEHKQSITMNKPELSMSKKDTEPAIPDESMLHDFSIFRRNIVKTNLDSTRLVTPKQQQPPKYQRAKTEHKPKIDSNFKTPSRASNKRPVRAVRQRPQPLHLENRFRQIVESESDIEEGDCVNASDDSDVDKTYNSNSSENSWSQKSSSENDENEEEIKKNKRIKARAGKENTAPKKTTKIRNRKNNQNDLIYLDLTKEEVVVQSSPEKSPLSNRDANFDKRLQDILRSCRPDEKSKMPATPKSTSKRKLFTPNFGMEDELNVASAGEGKSETPKCKLPPLTLSDRLLLDDDELVHFQGPILPPGLQICNKPLESVKKGKPIFKISTPARKQNTPTAKTTPSSPVAKVQREQRPQTPDMKYSFLKSLDECVSKSYCHADALHYRENYRQKKEECAQKLYDLYNKELFDNKLNVPLKWNKKLLNTAGRCLNKKRLGQRLSIVELSEKVLTSPDRLRCTLIHELCHAATWIFNGESGHGATWKDWARRANYTFPELPKIGVCHQYDIEYKYTYKCTLCSAKSHAHSKSKKVENIRCAYCHGAIEIFLNKKDKDGNIMPTPVREATGFAKFVKDNYKQHKQPNLKHADIMKILSSEFASLKVTSDAK